MAGIENLFAAEPMLPNVQTTKLPDDPQQWAEVITTRLREQYPEVTRLPLTVEYRKKDPQSGTGIGAIQVTDPATSRTLFVPFIIKKFELFPLDVWMESKSQEVHPLTNDTFKEEFFATSMSDGLDQRPADAAGQYFNDPSLWTSNYPPLQGRYSYASGGFDILDQISDTIKKEHIEIFRKSLEKNAHAIPKFKAMKKAAGALELVTKLAKMKSEVETNNFAASAEKLIPVGATSIKREGYDKYSIISMADQLFDLSGSKYMNREDCAKFLSQLSAKPWDFLHEVDQEGEKMLVVKKAPEKGVFLYDDIRPNAENADEFAIYEVTNKAGMHLMGMVFPYVVNFAGKKVNQKLFISANQSSMQSQIAGVKRPDSDHFQKLLAHPKGAHVGQTGTFIYIEKGKAIATIPVTLTAIEEYGPMTAVTLDGQKIQISKGYGGQIAHSSDKKDKNFLDAHGMLEVRPKEYIIPRHMVWYPMEGFQDVSSSVKEYTTKEAAAHLTADPLTVRWTGIVYEVSGSGMSKTAVDERRFKLLLATRGTSLEKIAQIEKKARTVGIAKVHGLLPLRDLSELNKHANDTYAQLESICAKIRFDLVKEAAEVDDAMTVDALLSLGFINPENLTKFVSYRPVFVKVSDYIAELVLAARLGLKDLNEAALVTVMSRLGEVIEGLKKVENGLKKPNIKTAGAKLDKAHKALTAAGAVAGLGMAAKSMRHKKEAEAKGGDPVSFTAGLNKNAAAKPAEKKPAEKKPEAKTSPGASAGAAGGAPAAPKMPELPKDIGSAPHSGNPKGENPFADGMADGELGGHMFLDKWRKDAKAMLQYMNGKRLSEANKATSAMSIGMQPPKGMKPAKAAPLPGAGGSAAGGGKK